MSLISFAKTWATGEVLYAADLEAMKAAIVAVVNGGLDDANVVSGANIDPSKIGDYSADDTEFRVHTDPFPSSVISKPTTLEGELARIRFMLKTVLGTTYWYESSVTGVKVHTTGDVKWTIKSSADTGWVLLNDGTIGNAASSGSTRANADTEALFTLIWTNFSDAQCPLSSGTRAGDVTAAASYAANKNVRLPLMAGRVPGVAGTPATASETDYITGTATAGSAAPAGTTITLSANGSAPPADDLITGFTLATTAGAGSGQVRTISDYVAATRVVTVSVAWVTTTDNTTQYAIYKTIPTRTLGTTLGSDTTVQVLSHTHLVDDTDNSAGGSPSNVSAGTVANDPAIIPVVATGVTTAISRYVPTSFINAMVKL